VVGDVVSAARPAAPPVASTPSRAAIEVRYRGATQYVHTLDVLSRLRSASGVVYSLGELYDFGASIACEQCATPPPPGPTGPPPVPGQMEIRNGAVLATFGAGLVTYISHEQCPDGRACIARRPVPDGAYSLSVNGICALPPTPIALPIASARRLACAPP
jgi:hypothetical protein